MKSINSLLKPFDNKLESPFIMNPSRFAGGWDWEDDMTSYATQGAADAAWVSDNTAYTRVNITDNDIDFTGNGSPTRDIYHELGFTLDDTALVMRYKIYFTTHTAGVGFGQFWLGLTDIPTGTYSDSQDSLTYKGNRDSNLKLNSSNGASMIENAGTAFTPNVSTSTDYWVEMIRTSATNATLQFFTNSAFTTSLTNGSITMSSSTIGLDTVIFRSDGAAGTNGNTVGTMTDFQIADGVTVAP